MPQQTFKLRPYQSADEQPALALWQRSWQQAYPQIDFAKRVDWFREHWSDLKLEFARSWSPNSTPRRTISPASSPYRREPAISTRSWWRRRSSTSAWAMRWSMPPSISAARASTCTSTRTIARALGFYQKCGFVIAGEDVNRRSGAPVYMMTWRPD